jgi:CRP-like cAMP-binding protein
MRSTGNKVGAGKSIVNRHERSFQRGSLMFIEGESSTEMFIIRSGLVRILKQEGENTIELAQLGPGSVLGELSLLDHQPRSATAQVVEDTSVTVIDEELFTRTLRSIPGWLENMIQLVVKRLRDTMKKTGDDIVVKSIGGVIKIILLIREKMNNEEKTEELLYTTTVKEMAYAIIGIGGGELEKIFLHLILKEMIRLKKDDTGREFIEIVDRDALLLYMQYLRMHQRGSELVGESFDEKAFSLLETIRETGEKNGRMMAHGNVQLSEQQLEITLQRQQKGRFIDPDALDMLMEHKMLMLQDDATESRHGRHARKVFLFNPSLIESVLLLRKWLPVFREEVVF